MAQQQIITKPYVGELQDDDSLFINHDGALRQVKKKDTDFASSEYVRTYVDNATVASARNATNATNATNDADGNAINTTYRKVSDSYSKSEVDAAVNGKVNKSGDTMTGKLTAPKIETGTDEANYFQSKKFRGQGDASTYYHAVDFGYANHNMVDFHEYGGVWNFYQNTEGKSNTGSLVASIQPDGVHAPLKGNADTATSATKATQDSDGNAINTTYRKVSDSYSKSEIDAKLTGKVSDSYSKSEIDAKLTGKADKATSLSGYGITDAYTKTQTDDLLAKKASASHTHTKSQITDMPTKLSQFTNDKGFKKITWSTITIATSAWSNKTATVSVSGVTADNAVDVAPVEPTFDAYINAGIRATSQGSGTLTFACKTVPTVAISVNVKVYN